MPVTGFEYERNHSMLYATDCKSILCYELLIEFVFLSFHFHVLSGKRPPGSTMHQSMDLFIKSFNKNIHCDFCIYIM